MSLREFDVLLVDAANTIIHKPGLWPALLKVLHRYGYNVDEKELKVRHKLLSEIIHFPDRTDAKFYRHFNSELLLMLGIRPTEAMLNEIFDACTYLPWETFEDAKALSGLQINIAVLSNFKLTLSNELTRLFGPIFSNIITSEEIGISKPDRRFYEEAINILGTPPEKVLYIGDSLRLDIIPAMELGIKTKLIDREKIFLCFKDRITSLDQIVNWK